MKCTYSNIENLKLHYSEVKQKFITLKELNFAGIKFRGRPTSFLNFADGLTTKQVLRELNFADG